MDIKTDSFFGDIYKTSSSRLINEFIFRYDNNHLDIDPFYQRGLVWTEKAREALVKSFLTGRNIGSFIVTKEDGEKWELMDGKQRFKAIYDFFKGDLMIDGKSIDEITLDGFELKPYSNQLSTISVIILGNDGGFGTFSDKEKVRLFIEFNGTGTMVSKDHLKMLSDKYLGGE